VLDTELSHPSPGEVVETLRGVVPEFTRADVCLAIENHDRFPAATLAEIVECLGSRHVGICLDTANSLGCAEGLDTLLRVLGPWVVNVHAKDLRVARLPHQKGFIVEGCPAGQGLLDVPWLLAKLRERGRDPNVILELWPPPEATVAESVAKEDAWAAASIRYLRRFIPQ
jgi:sugar phosphate isomerase/epimerase